MYHKNESRYCERGRLFVNQSIEEAYVYTFMAILKYYKRDRKSNVCNCRNTQYNTK